MRMLIAISLVFLFVMPCFASENDKLIPTIGGASAFFCKAGPVRASITATWPLVTYDDWKIYLDGLIVKDDMGVGISTDVITFANLLNFDKYVYPVVPIKGLIERTAVGVAVLTNGEDYIHDGGVYLRTNLVKVKF
ncbi:MAG: hypothetical protein BWY74_03879 [Firmicutes bacterium ADurb.Bin419]|nr:MAG: hypothetical protein BWY74_03879 [Firmicutes bacterium ADurb.Bin419]